MATSTRKPAAARKAAPKAVAAKRPAGAAATRAAAPKPTTAAAAKRAPPPRPAAAAARRPSARARGLTIDAYVGKLAAGQRALATTLLGLIKAAAPTATAGIKWGRPVFESNGPMFYLWGAGGHLTFGFWRGAELAARGFAELEGNGDKMRHLKLTAAADVDPARLRALIAAAVELNRDRGDPTR